MTREKSENDETRDDTRDESGEKKWREKNIAESSRDERRGGGKKRGRRQEEKRTRLTRMPRKNENENVCACALILAHFERVLEGGPSLSI